MKCAVKPGFPIVSYTPLWWQVLGPLVVKGESFYTTQTTIPSGVYHGLVKV